MTLEWIRFFITAFILLFALCAYAAAVLGVVRFGFSMNRMHAGGIGDTLGIFCVIAALLVAAGIHSDTVKLSLIVLFMWFTSPVSSHFLSQIEYYTNPDLYKYMKRDRSGAKNDKEGEG
ncbi:MAG: monovalent cation/H(+) antiporter subunit G [Lachnospiraceae bacterium]|nr:monovalent cation/H(+) antiporter subunit G [Lachnospiraceae bacterium]